MFSLFVRELNLLPPERRRQVQFVSSMRRARRLIFTIFLSVATVSVIGVGLWGWLKYMAWVPNDEVLAQRAVAYVNLVQEANYYNAQADAILAIERARIVWSPFVASLLRVVPSGVTVERIVAEQEAGTFVLQGVASSRVTLVVFERSLQELERVLAVDAPAENWLARDNPRYQFTITLKKEE